MGVEPTHPAVQDTTVLKTAAATGPLPSPEFRAPFYTRPRQPRRKFADSQRGGLISVSLTCCLLLSIPGRARPPGEPSLPDFPLFLHPDLNKNPSHRDPSAAEPQPNESELKKAAKEFSHRVTEVNGSPPCAPCLCERRSSGFSLSDTIDGLPKESKGCGPNRSKITTSGRIVVRSPHRGAPFSP